MFVVLEGVSEDCDTIFEKQRGGFYKGMGVGSEAYNLCHMRMWDKSSCGVSKY